MPAFQIASGESYDRKGKERTSYEFQHCHIIFGFSIAGTPRLCSETTDRIICFVASLVTILHMEAKVRQSCSFLFGLLA